MKTSNTIAFENRFMPFALLLGSVFFAGCGGKLSVHFEGTFVNFAKSEFSEASDTLVIKKSNDQFYVIYQSTGIILLNEAGHKGKPILEKQVWKAQLDGETGTLIQPSKGRVIRVDGDSLILERAVYRRVP